MKIELLYDGPVSPNFATGDGKARAKRDQQVTCAYPLSTKLANGTVACVYRQGATKHSHDGILMLQLSRDGGQSWSAPRTVVNGLLESPTQTVVTGGICQMPSGALLAVYGTVEGLPPGVYPFAPEAAQCARHVFMVRSEDEGMTWSPPERLDLSSLTRAGITAGPFVAANGTVCMPIENKLPTGNSATALIFSHDDGRTFGPPITVAADDSGRLNLCDARFDVLPNGRIISLIWTFLEENEVTIAAHRSFSDDHGLTWTEPENIGCVGQITAPLVLPNGRVIAVSNYRHTPMGTLLWVSKDGGTSWAADEPIQLWDAEQRVIVGKSVAIQPPDTTGEQVWDELQRFSFGTPDLVLLNAQTALLTYYATVDDVVHVRACGLRIT